MSLVHLAQYCEHRLAAAFQGKFFSILAGDPEIEQRIPAYKVRPLPLSSKPCIPGALIYAAAWRRHKRAGISLEQWYCALSYLRYTVA